MPEVVVVGAFKMKAGKEQEGLELLQGLIEPTHREDGCILYALHRGTDDPGRLAFIERWASREQLDAHLQTEHVQTLLARAEQPWDEVDITVYEAVPGGEPAKGALAENAGG
jgi:quinol monooxygenase YgiN